MAESIYINPELSENFTSINDIYRRLGYLVGLMHNTGFYHEDLFMRNILVGSHGVEPLLQFIDCHQGRWIRLSGRACAYDLGCYEKWAATFFDEETRGNSFAGYLEARPGENLEKLLRLTDRARQRLVLHRQKRKRYIHKKKQHLEPTFKPRPKNTIESSSECQCMNE